MCPALQALLRVTPLRNFFLLPTNYAQCRSVLVQRFGELLRKSWNPRNFKGQVSAGLKAGTCYWHHPKMLAAEEHRA
jgi:hypothetical protein